tara:strand:+ start:18624 stop:20075 length:1452 start_codon:yes stop_codon:yes gene_type:complete
MNISVNLLAGVLAVQLAVVFSPSTFGESLSSSDGAKAYEFPKIEGQISTDSKSLEAASTDFGGSKKARPLAVIRPKTVSDVSIVIKWANENNIFVTPRGTGHSASGQSLAKDGIVLKTELLTNVTTLSKGLVEAEAGARLFQVVVEANKNGAYIPALPAFIAQSVGGILSVGGVGPGSHTDGLTIDNIEELTVVAGNGEILVCSSSKNPELFDAVLGGLGQFGVIAKAVFKVKPAKKYIHVVKASFPDVTSVIQEMLDSANNDSIYAIDGYTWKEGSLNFSIEKAVWSDSLDPPKVTNVFPDRNSIIKESIDFTEPVEYGQYIQALNFLHGWWGQGLFPWADFFIPENTTIEFFNEAHKILGDGVLSGETDFLGISVVPKKSPHNYSIQQMPVTEMGDFYFVPQFTPNFKSLEEAEMILALNRRLLRLAMDLGGKTYVIDVLPQTEAQWKQHFADNWDKVLAAKKKYDPKGIMSSPLPGLVWK